MICPVVAVADCADVVSETSAWRVTVIPERSYKPGPKKTDQISIVIEDLSRNSANFGNAVICLTPPPLPTRSSGLFTAHLVIISCLCYR